MHTKKSHPKGHHYTQESPTKPHQVVKDHSEPRHKAKNYIKPRAKNHITTFIRAYHGPSYYTDR